MSDRHEFTIKQFAEREQVNERTVRRWIEKGAVDVRRTPGIGIRIRVADDKAGNRGQRSH